MATYLDYLAWRGDLTMKERPFNKVDNLILAELVYYHFERVMTDANRTALTLRGVWARHQVLEQPDKYWNNDPTHLLEPCCTSQRFGDVLVTDFVDQVDTERGIQFAAATFHLPDGTRYIAFRGTDSSIVGWKEDFDLTYMEETPAQSEAVRYLSNALRHQKGSVRVGGHSKGGNLAIYAAAFCQGNSKRILEVYSNDGPGFNQAIVQRAEYQAILPKVFLILPSASVVSILLFNKKEKEIVRSSAGDGVRQHLPATWQVERDHFLPSEQTSLSIRLNELNTKWLERMDDEEKKAFISTVYGILTTSGLSSVEELEENPLLYVNAILKAAAGLSEEKRHGIRDSLLKLAEVSREMLVRGIRD